MIQQNILSQLTLQMIASSSLTKILNILIKDCLNTELNFMFAELDVAFTSSELDKAISELS